MGANTTGKIAGPQPPSYLLELSAILLHYGVTPGAKGCQVEEAIRYVLCQAVRHEQQVLLDTLREQRVLLMEQGKTDAAASLREVETVLLARSRPVFAALGIVDKNRK